MKRILGCIAIGLLLVLSVSRAEALWEEMIAGYEGGANYEGMAGFFPSPSVTKVDVAVQQKDDMWVYDYVVHNIAADDPEVSLGSFIIPNIWEQIVQDTTEILQHF